MVPKGNEGQSTEAEKGGWGNGDVDAKDEVSRRKARLEEGNREGIRRMKPNQTRMR